MRHCHLKSINLLPALAPTLLHAHPTKAQHWLCVTAHVHQCKTANLNWCLEWDCHNGTSTTKQNRCRPPLVLDNVKLSVVVCFVSASSKPHYHKDQASTGKDILFEKYSFLFAGSA